jgi:hypothetical protein
MRNLLLVFLLLCLYAGTIMAAEVWPQPLTCNEQILFAILNAKRMEAGLPVLQLDGMLLSQAHSGQGTVLSASSLSGVIDQAQTTVLNQEVKRVGLAATQTQSQVTVVLVTK